MLIGDYPTAYPGYSDVSAGPRLYDGRLFVGTLPNYDYTLKMLENLRTLRQSFIKNTYPTALIS